MPIAEVGPWVHEKHDRLRRYVTISSKVRAMFLEPGRPVRATYVLVHVSAMDLQRNVGQAIDAAEGHQFDAVAPGWRTAVDLRQAPRGIRLALAAKHNKAAEFWEKIRHIQPQKGFTY